MDWLNSLYFKIEAQKIEIEQTCRSLQSLFKSWPVPEQEPILNAESKSEAAKDALAANSNPNKNLTEEEQEGVNLVDKLLLKAQKARQVQQKLEESKRSGQQKNLHSRLSSSTNKDQLQTDLPTKNSFIKFDKSNNPLDKTKPELRSCTDMDQEKKIAALDQSKKAVCDSRKSTKYVNKSGPGINQNKKAAGVDNNRKVVNNSVCKGGLKDQRPPSRSAGKRVAPAHVSAPFQTNPRLVNSKLKTEYGSSTGRVLSAVKNSKIKSDRSKGSYSAPVPKSTVVKPQTNISTTCKFETDTGIVKDATRSLEPESQNLCTDSSKYSDTSECDHGGEENDKFTKTESNIADKPQVPKEMEIAGDLQDLQLQEEFGFRLVEDGHSLSIPSKYKKLAGMNRKLRQKLFTQKVTTKVDSPQFNLQFPLQLQQTFEDPVTSKLQIATKQATYLVNVYKNLGDLLESLNLQALDGDSTIEAVLMAKKCLEYILTKFHDTELQLHSADLGILRLVSESPRYCSRVICEPFCNSSVMWNNVKDLDHSQPRLLKYRSFKQLERYISLFHRIQLLKFQIDSMDKMAEQTLPLLQTLNPTTSDFIQVLRCSHSLLSTNPNRVPVIVRDTIQDIPENQDTDIT